MVLISLSNYLVWNLEPCQQ